MQPSEHSAGDIEGTETAFQSLIVSVLISISPGFPERSFRADNRVSKLRRQWIQAVRPNFLIIVKISDPL